MIFYFFKIKKMRKLLFKCVIILLDLNKSQTNQIHTYRERSLYYVKHTDLYKIAFFNS